jgi:hypothetical protein
LARLKNFSALSLLEFDSFSKALREFYDKSLASIMGMTTPNRHGKFTRQILAEKRCHQLPI